jgi:hypothetical protein
VALPTRQCRPLSGLGVISLCVTLLYMVYATHGHTQPQPTDPLAVISAVESQLSGIQTVAYAPTGNATGIIQQAMCQADETVTTELTCTILFNDQTGAYDQRGHRPARRLAPALRTRRPAGRATVSRNSDTIRA